MNSLLKYLIFTILLVSPWSNSRAQCSQIAADSIRACRARNPWLGDTVGTCGAVKNGCVQRYKAGRVYYSPATGVHEVHGRIFDKYNEYNGPDSLLGLPLTDELSTSDGVGRVSRFQNGSIYWHPAADAHIVYGSIKARWDGLGSEKGPLGFPVSDEFGLLRNGRTQRFQRGNLYYHPTFGTHPVIDYIFIQYSNKQWEAGPLGYPTSDPCRLQGTPMRVGQTFEHGVLYETPDSLSLRSEMERRKIEVRNQGSRGTCSVFSMVCLLEFAYTTWCGLPFGGWASHLSVEYSNHAANMTTGRTCDGDFFSTIAVGYDSLGIIEESRWPYDLSTSYNYAYYTTNAAFLAKWDSLKTEGRRLLAPGLKMPGHFIKPNGPPGMTSAQFDSVLIYLKKCVPVAIGRAHSLAAVGFVLNPAEAGGGHMIFKNSWGVSSGDNGYITETFQFVKDSSNDAFVYDIPLRCSYPYETVALRKPSAGTSSASLLLAQNAVVPYRIVSINGRTVAAGIGDARTALEAAGRLKRSGLARGVYSLVKGGRSMIRFVR